MAKRRGYTLVVIGLVFGLAFGFSIRELKRQIKIELANMLEKEAFTSSGCHFVYDTIDVSLLRQRAIADNPRVECAGVPHLSFKRIIASFELSRIRSRIIDLRLRLIDGDSLGFGADSTTFKFIDSLAAPIDPARDTPDRFKVKLQQLSVVGLNAADKLAGVDINGFGATLEMRRTPSNDFELLPLIPAVTVTRGQKELTLEQISTKLILEDAKLRFYEFKARVAGIEANGNFTLTNDRSGELDGSFVVSGQLASLLDQTTGRFNAPLELSGSTHTPIIRGNLITEDLTVSGVSANQQLSATFEFDKNQRLVVSTLNVGLFPADISLLKPLIIAPDAASGEAEVKFTAPYSGSLNLSVAGTQNSPSLTLAGKIGTANGAVFETSLRALDFTKAVIVSGSGKIALPSIPALNFTLQNLEDAKAKIALSGAQQSINGSAVIDLKSGSGSLELAAGSALIAQQIPCGVLSGAMRYNWSGNAPTQGNGSIDLAQLSGGCGLGVSALEKPASLPITSGTVKVNKLTLISLGKPFILDGTINAESGPDIQASGTIDLTTIRALAPELDELSGTAEGSVRVTSRDSRVLINGEIDLKNVRLEQAKMGLEIEGLTGKAVIKDSTISMNELSGQFNGGQLSINGRVNLDSLANSEAQVKFKNAAFEPTNNFSVTASGEVTIGQGANGIPQLVGKVFFDSGEFSDSINLSQIVAMAQRAITSRRAAASGLVPLVGLDLEIAGDRNLFINTNLGAAELSANVKVAGSSREPQLRGDVIFRSGWIGFQGRRFEIHSGKLIFTPPGIEPTVELIAETILPARTGENVLVILQGSGPLSNPKISLSSDQPITERELLALVSSGTGFVSRTRANTVGATRSNDDGALLSDLTRLRLQSFFSKLVDVDSLSVSPLFNPGTGLIEPALVAEKLVAKDLTLIGESTLSGVEGISRARLQLDVSDNVAVGGLIESDSSRSGVPAELQITYTPLSRQAHRLSVSIRGNKQISERDILAGLRLSNLSFITPRDILGLEEQLKVFYGKQGYGDTQVRISCDEFVESCTAIALVIDEGRPQSVTSIVLEGTPLPQQISAKTITAITSLSREQVATDEFRLSRMKSIRTALRSEGFVAARIGGEYRCDPVNDTCILAISTEPGAPISFIFSGNELFSASDFLNAIRLFERNQPFGNNTIAVLISTIERMYREQGRLFTTVSYDTNIDLSGRTFFRITIDEGKPVTIAEVTFPGLPDVVRDEMLAALTREQRLTTIKPTLPIAEEFEANAFSLVAALRGLGFLAATVDSKIIPIGDTNSVTVAYRVELGERSARANPILHNWPSDLVVPPELEAADYPANLANRGDELVGKLKDEGYLNATASLRSSAVGSANEVWITAGERTLIRSIQVSGNPTISSSVILEASRLIVGQPLARATLEAGRSRLLKLGLFARASVTSQPNGAVSIEVIERSSRNAEVGIGANSEYGLHLFGEAADRGIFGDGRQLALRLDGYYDNDQDTISKGTASLQYRAPFVFDSNFGLSEDLRFQRFDLATLPYDLDRWSLASFLNGEDELWTYSVGHLFSADSLDNVSPDAVLSDLDTGEVQLSALSATITYDERDAPLNPQAGFLVALDSKLAWSAFGSDADFIEASPRFSWAAALMPQWGVAYQLRVGVREPFGSTDEIPITQRYFIGGRTSVRGYRENSLGPKGSEGSAQGGRYLANQNVELRYKPMEAIALIWFFDSGSTYLNSINADDLRHSTGVGIRYLSPVGPIGFDIGLPIARRSDEDPYRLHFSIGTIF